MKKLLALLLVLILVFTLSACRGGEEKPQNLTPNEEFSNNTQSEDEPLIKPKDFLKKKAISLKTVLTTTIEHENIDPKRVYIVGVSMGGFTSCQLIDEMPPNTFAAAMPMSGCSNLQNPEKHLNTAFRMYHNVNDTIVNERCSKNLNEQLLGVGHKNTKYELFYYGDHGTSVNIVFSGHITTFFPWLFEQKLP